MEEWKAIKGMYGYEASNLGRIRSLTRTVNKGTYSQIRMGMILCEHTDRLGYKRVSISLNGKVKGHTVHRLVMLAFHGVSNLVVNHIDADKKNNRLGNLEYVSQKENIIHSVLLGLRTKRKFKEVL